MRLRANRMQSFAMAPQQRVDEPALCGDFGSAEEDMVDLTMSGVRPS
jgi:hypothetical protein